MSKSAESDAGTVYLAEDLAKTAKKFKRAVTDSENSVRYDPANKPGVANLLGILGAATGADPEALADDYSQYGPLKSDTADAVVALLEPIQQRLADLKASPAETTAALAVGADRAREIASATYARAVNNIGLLPKA